jgi:hypothetical protein
MNEIPQAQILIHIGGYLNFCPRCQDFDREKGDECFPYQDHPGIPGTLAAPSDLALATTLENS